MFRRRGWSMSSARNSDRDGKVKHDLSDGPKKKKDTKIRYYEDDPEATEVAVRRRPRRHTTGGSNHAEVIQKAKQVVANGDPSGQYGTIDRKQLVSILKQRYGNDLEKYNQRAEGGRPSGAPGTSYQSTNIQDLPVEDRYPLGQQRIPGSVPKPETPIPVGKEADTGHQYYKISQLHNMPQKPGGASPLVPRQQYRTTTTTTTTVVRKGSDASQSSAEGRSIPVSQSVAQSPRMGTRAQMQTMAQLSPRQPQASSLQNGHRRSTESMNSDASLEQQWSKPAVERILFLQLKDEIKRAAMPKSISSVDTIKALFVTTFPGKVSMPRLDEKGAIYIKDREAGIFYELDDISDVRPRCHLKVHERSSSVESYELVATRSQVVHATPQPLPEHRLQWADDPNYATSSLRRPIPTKKTEYSHDAPIRLQRSGSGSSLKSENVIPKPAYLSPRGKEPEPRTTVRDQDWGIVEETVRTEYMKQAEVPAHPATLPKSVKLGWHAMDETIPRTSNTTIAPPSVTLNATTLISSALPASIQTSVQASILGSQPTSTSLSLQAHEPPISPVSPGSDDVFAPPPILSPRPIYIPEPRQKPVPADTPSVPPKIPPKRVPPPVKPRNKAREEARRKLSSEVSGSPTSPTTVEEQLADLTELLHSALISDDEDGAGEDSPETRKPDKPPEKPPLPVRQSSRNAVSLARAGAPSSPRTQPRAIPKPEVSLSPGSPSSLTRSIDMVGCALSMKSHVLTLRSQLDEIRALQSNSVKQFRSFIGQAKNELNGIFDRMNNNAPDYPGENTVYQGRRQLLQCDKEMYRQHVDDTEEKLQCLEDNTEVVRQEVIQRKIIVEPDNLDRLGGDLQELTHALAELRGQFSSLHDTMKITMSGELEIIVQEEKFLKEEPGKLDNMLARCKHLSGTIFTLQKLASVQQMSRSGATESTVSSQVSGSPATVVPSDTEGDVDGEKGGDKQARMVRFKDQAF